MLKTSNIAISATISERLAEAHYFAQQYGFTFVTDYKKIATNFAYLLLLTPTYLGLVNTSAINSTPFYIDFLTKQMQYRLKQASLRKEFLARAIGINPSKKPSIVDATAGLGRDSFILAALGFELTLIERSPIVYLLLADALMRANLDPNTHSIANRLKLIHADAINWLRNLPQKPDIICLDPMFPSRQKSASVKKELATLQDLLGKDHDCDELFLTAINSAKRVILKRPKFAPDMLSGKKASFSIKGNSSRFDIYITISTPGSE